MTESTECRIPLQCKVFYINVPLVNNKSKLYIEYSFARYYKAPNLTLMYLLTAYSSKQIHQNRIWCSVLLVIHVQDVFFRFVKMSSPNTKIFLRRGCHCRCRRRLQRRRRHSRRGQWRRQRCGDDRYGRYWCSVGACFYLVSGFWSKPWLGWSPFWVQIPPSPWWDKSK